MATCSKKCASKSKAVAAKEVEDEFVTLSLEIPLELLNIIDNFAKQDGIAAPEELALMIQIGLSARMDNDVEIITEMEEKAEKKGSAKKEVAKAEKKVAEKKAPAKKEAAKAEKKVPEKKAPAKKEAAKAEKKVPEKKAPAKKEAAKAEKKVAEKKAPAKKSAKK